MGPCPYFPSSLYPQRQERTLRAMNEALGRHWGAGILHSGCGEHVISSAAMSSGQSLGQIDFLDVGQHLSEDQGACVCI